MRIPTEKIHRVLTLLLAFALPLYRQISAILIALLLLNWILEWNWKEKIERYKAHKITFLPAALYLLYCVGMLFTSNTAFGWKDLETKLSLLLLPLIFGAGSDLSKVEVRKIFTGFIAGCCVAIVCCYAQSWSVYLHEAHLIETKQINNPYPSTKYFFSGYLSYFMHPSYFAMYLGLAMMFIFSLFLSEKEPISGKSKLLFTIILLAFAMTIILLASRMGLIVFGLVLLWVIMHIIIKKKYYLVGAGSLVAVILAAILLYKNSEILASRINYVLSALETSAPDKTSSESSTVRLLIWKQASHAIAEHRLLGAGTGDVKDVLLEKYAAEGMTGALDHRLNAHNQMLQTGVALGIPGLLLVLACFILPLFIRKHRYLMFSFFCISMLLNSLVEATLEIQVGVVFFAFFFSILSIHNDPT